MNTKQNSQSQESKIAVIANDIKYIKEDMASIKANFKELAGAFITKAALEEIAKRTEERLVALEKAANFWKYMNPTLTYILGSIIMFLLTSYLQSR